MTIPFPSPPPPKDAKYKLQYERPSSINVTGSYPLKTATRTEGELSIDLVVTMPKAIFQEKDYLNYRYFYKRAYYLACLAAGIKSSNTHNFKLSFQCLNGNQLQPILIVRSSDDGGPVDFASSKCCIKILLTFPDGTFPEAKLLPGTNCIRPRGDEKDGADKPLTPTPFYNSTLQSDAAITAYLKLLHNASGKCDAFKDACILGRIWLRQRGFGSKLGQGGFGNFEWAILVALLLQPNPGAGRPTLSPGYSSYQLFKGTLQFIATHNLSKSPFMFQAQGVNLPRGEVVPVFFDGPRGLNVLFKMTTSAYSRLQLEAKITINTLGDSLFDQFDATFILKTDVSRYRYDATLELPLSALGLDPTSYDYEEKLGNICQKFYNTLTRALTDRTTLIALRMPDTGHWPISSSRNADNRYKCIVINFATDPDNAHRTIDRGPPAENKQEAAAFRKFWGDKSELRRFKDGSILESVVWSTQGSAAAILEQIVLYTIKRHFGTQVAEEVKFSSDPFEHLITSGRIQGQSGITAFTPRMAAFTAIEKDIRSLEGMPLQVRHIRASDEQLRYSAIDPLQNTAASIVVQFEASARWPDDLCAIQRTKIAFLLKIAELLLAAHPAYAARVGLENPSQPSWNQAYLDITVHSRSIFRLRIHHDREATLLERQLKNKSIDAYTRESAAIGLSLHKRHFLQIPSHTQVVQKLCTRHAALSPTIRLTKRWFASHLLCPHFTPELIELLVLRTFLQPHPWTVPSCATTGFLRTLAWISRWDWRHVPLIVDFSDTLSASSGESEAVGHGQLKSEDIETIQTRFEAWRRIDPAMNRVALFAATNLDTDGSTWTDRGKPEKVVATRMTALAKAATSAIRAQEQLLSAAVIGEERPRNSEFSPEALFTPTIQDFDIVILISSKFAATKKRKKSDSTFKNLEIQQAASASQDTGTELVRLFAEDLQNVYGDSLLWFYDPETLDRIAGLWNPIVTRPRTFKVKAGWNSVPSGSRDSAGEEERQEGEIQINRAAICNEIKRLGGALISRLEVNR